MGEMQTIKKHQEILKLSANFSRASIKSKKEFSKDKSIQHLKKLGWTISRHEYVEDNAKRFPLLCKGAPLKKQLYVFIHGEGRLLLNGKLVDAEVISFRGSKVKQNYFYTDLKLQTTPFYQPLINPQGLDHNMRVHCGFSQYLFRASENPSRYIEKFFIDVRANINNPNKLFIITGHSLGGAAASLLAASIYGKDSQMKNIDNLYLVTFGQPAVSKNHYKTYYENTFKHYIRFINQGDPIPYSTTLFGYKAFGSKLVCKSRKFCVKRKKDWFKHCASDGGLHSMKEYLAIIKGLTQYGISYAKTHHCTFSNKDNDGIPSFR